MHDKSQQSMVTAMDAQRVEVWVAMADHFLDTETRQGIPLTALRCVEAGLSVDEARLIWQYEVSPAVGDNLWSVAGEWACWDRDWLVATIQQARGGWRNTRGIGRWLGYRLLVHFNHGVWVAISRCMDLLWSLTSAAERERTTQDLTLLSAHYFDFCGRDLSKLEPEHLLRLRALHTGPLRYILAPALVPGEAASAVRRLQRAFPDGPTT
jgi:hypothetical protein